MRKRLVWAVLAVSLLLAIAVDLAGSSRSDAQSELDAARRDVAAATESLEAVLSELEATQLRGDALAEEYWQIESGLVKVQGEVAASEAVLAELADRREGLRAEVRVIALDQYVLRSDDLTVGDHESEADRAAAETLARLVVGGDNDAIDQLALVNEEHEQNRERLLAQRDEHATALAGVQRTQSALFSELDQLEALRETLGQELQALESALDQLEQAEQQRVAAAAEQARIAEERRRAEAAAAAAAERARLIPTPAPSTAERTVSHSYAGPGDPRAEPATQRAVSHRYVGAKPATERAAADAHPDSVGARNNGDGRAESATEFDRNRVSTGRALHAHRRLQFAPGRWGCSPSE